MPTLRRTAPAEGESDLSPPLAGKAAPSARTLPPAKVEHASATTSQPAKPPRAAAGGVKRARGARNTLPLDGRDYQPTQVVQSHTGEYSATMIRKAQLLRKIKEHAQSARAACASGRGGGGGRAGAAVIGAPMAHSHWDHQFNTSSCALLGGLSRTGSGHGGEAFGYDWRGAPQQPPGSSYDGGDALQQQTAQAHSAVVRAHIAYAAQQRQRLQQRRRQELQDALAAQPRRELAPGQLLQCAGLNGCAPLPRFALHSPPRAPLPRFESSGCLFDLGATNETAPMAAQHARYHAPLPQHYPYSRAPSPADHLLHAHDGDADAAAEPETARVRERILQLAHQLVVASSALGRGEPESERVLSTLIHTLRAMPQGALTPARDEECASADALRLDSPSSALQPALLLEQVPTAASELEPLHGFGVPSLECFDSMCGDGAIAGRTVASCAPSTAGDGHAAFDASSPWAVGADGGHIRAGGAPPSDPLLVGVRGAVAAHRCPPCGAPAACGALGSFAATEPRLHEFDPDDLDELDLMDFNNTLARGTQLHAHTSAGSEQDILGRIGQAFSSQWRAELDDSESLLSRPSDEVLDDIINSLNAVA